MRIIACILLCLSWVRTLAQTDSIKTTPGKVLPIITVTTSKNDAGAEPFIQNIPLTANVQAGNSFLSDILATQSDAFIRLNSGAALATTSLRGTTAQQTPILWCGLNLQSPSNGNMDLSLLPAFLFSSAEIIYGGTATLNGSGHVGGAINLNNNALFADTFTCALLTGYSSFNTYVEGIKLLKATKCTFNRTTLYYSSAQNNFLFYNRAEFNAPLQTMTNAAFNELHIMQENSFRLNSSQIIDVKYWYAKSHRQIPPTMLTYNDSSYQDDESHRAMVAWQYCGSKTVYYVRQHISYETLNYYDGSTRKVYPSKSLLSSSEIENHYYPTSKWHITSGLQFISAHAITDGYNQWHYRNETSLYTSARYMLSKRIALSASAREEYTIHRFIPPVFSSDATYIANTKYSFSVQWSKHYRLPTLNDLYWTPGGNMNIEPESGNLFQVTSHYNNHSKHVTYHINFAAYSNSLTNQIAWVPVNAIIWSPINYSHVWSRGLNLSAGIDFHLANQTIQFISNNSYTRVSQLDNTSIPSGTDNQLIYTPRFKTAQTLKWLYKNMALFASANYTSAFFTDENRAYYLPGFSTMDAGIECTLKLSKLLGIGLTLAAHNITNTRYEVLIYRPQPLRHYSLTLLLKFNT